jgi:HD superfamily phosphohydrolase
VHEGELVVEEKGIYSVEKFLIARRLMYWQVYLHKTNVAAEQMLTSALRRAKELTLKGEKVPASRNLTWFLQQKPGMQHNQEEVLQRFAHLDDTDIAMALKEWSEEKDPVLNFLATGLLNRRLYRLEWSQHPFTPEYVAATRTRLRAKFDAAFPDSYLLLEGKESNQAYSEAKEPIKILFNAGMVKPVSECSDVPLYTQEVTKYYLAYPK